MQDKTSLDSAPEFELRGNRFKPLTWVTMTPVQQRMTSHVLAGKRGAMPSQPVASCDTICQDLNVYSVNGYTATADTVEDAVLA